MDIDGRKLVLNDKVAVYYGGHVSGAWNASETHTFFRCVISKLNDSYSTFRPCSDAMLDDDIENAWNCVAISKDSNFSALGLIR